MILRPCKGLIKSWLTGIESYETRNSPYKKKPALFYHRRDLVVVGSKLAAGYTRYRKSRKQIELDLSYGLSMLMRLADNEIIDSTETTQLTTIWMRIN